MIPIVCYSRDRLPLRVELKSRYLLHMTELVGCRVWSYFLCLLVKPLGHSSWSLLCFLGHVGVVSVHVCVCTVSVEGCVYLHEDYTEGSCISFVWSCSYNVVVINIILYILRASSTTGASHECLERAVASPIIVFLGLNEMLILRHPDPPYPM